MPPVQGTVLLLHSSAGLYGADVQLLAIVRGLDPARWKAICVLPEPGPLVEPLEAAGAEVVIHPLAVLRRALVRPAGLVAMARAVGRDRRVLGDLARERGVTVVHDNTSVVLGGGAVARRAGAAHVVHVREIWTGGGRAERTAWPLMRRRILRADRVLCISEAVRAQFRGADTAALLRDGLPRTPRPPDRATSREALGLPADAFVVALVGRVHPWKGQDVLARALAEPELAALGAIGLLAGSEVPGSGQMRRLDELTRELGVQDRLVRLGFREDVDTVLGAADAVTVPSTRPEPLGLVALEAAAAGLPVVASAAGGVAEAVDDGRTGMLVRPGDHRELARALAWLAGDPPEAARWRASAPERVRREFSVQAMTERLQTTYDELANFREAP